MVLKIEYCEPAIKGNTATNLTKPCKLETGAEILCPAFVEIGDMIKVDTRTGEYLERVQGVDRIASAALPRDCNRRGGRSAADRAVDLRPLRDFLPTAPWENLRLRAELLAPGRGSSSRRAISSRSRRRSFRPTRSSTGTSTRCR